MSRILYFDCFAGASGDMILGALLDAGLPIEELRRALGSLALSDYEITAERVSRAGVAATKFRLHEATGADAATPGEDAPGGEHEYSEGSAGHHRHAHDTGEPSAPGPMPQSHRHGPAGAVGGVHRHTHRTLGEIEGLIRRSALAEAGRERAIALFRRLAETEAAIHQMPVEQVHLHEVGELDSIIDIVGSVFAVDWFGADRIVSSPLNVGGGMVKSAHGTFPVPAPATVALLRGVPVYSSGIQAELVTPTGALLVTAYAGDYGPVPPMTIERVGYGAGDRDFPGVPNTLRVLVGTAGSERGQRVVVTECEIDDMNPQVFGVVMDRLYGAGALEVFYAPVFMKKNRPGTLVTVIAPAAASEAVKAILFSETTTIGLRYQGIDRECLERETVRVETPYGPVRVKVAIRGGAVMNASPEFDDCARIAAERGIPVKQVLASAMNAFSDRGRS